AQEKDFVKSPISFKRKGIWPYINGCTKRKEQIVYGFLSRHKELSLRNPDKTSIARAKNFNRTTVIMTVPNKSSKILALCRKKQGGSLSSGERGVLVTAETCMMSTAAHLLSIMRVDGFRKTSFITWFKKFIELSRSSFKKPVLLLLDAYASHTKNVKFIKLVQEKNVIILVVSIAHINHRTRRYFPIGYSFDRTQSQSDTVPIGHISYQTHIVSFGHSSDRTQILSDTCNFHLTQSRLDSFHRTHSLSDTVFIGHILYRTLFRVCVGRVMQVVYVSEMCPIGTVSDDICVRLGLCLIGTNLCPIKSVSDRDCVRWNLCQIGTVSDGICVRSELVCVRWKLYVSNRICVRWKLCPIGTVPTGISVRLGLCPMINVRNRDSLYEQEVRKWLINHPGRYVTIHQVAKLYREALSRVAVVKTTVKSFEKCGIWI
ncbi:hypothetical protein X777_06140, partial [Ooceraea biroi]